MPSIGCKNHQQASFYMVNCLLTVFVSFILYVCWQLQLVVSTAKAEGSNGIRPVPHQIELSEIHPRRYNVSSQTPRSELLETRLKCQTQPWLKKKLGGNRAVIPCIFPINLPNVKTVKQIKAGRCQKNYYKTPYQTISEVYENETKISANL